MTDEKTQLNNIEQEDNEGKDGESGTSSVSDSNTEVEQLKAQCDEYLNGWKRAKADYANLKKETEDKQKNLVEFANTALIMEILPIYSNLKQALIMMDNGQLTISNEMKAWVEGIKHVKKQFADFLKQYEIEEIKTAGEKFNPQFHDAVSKEKKAWFEPDFIISELNPGYLFKGKVIVPAKVIVSA